MTVSKILKLQGFVWKTMQAWLDGKSCFSRTNASNFWRPLQSLLLRFSGYLFLIHSFSLCWQNFSKVNCFRFYWKLITWSSHAKSLFIYYSYASLNYFLVDISLVLFFSSLLFFSAPRCISSWTDDDDSVRNCQPVDHSSRKGKWCQS